MAHLLRIRWRLDFLLQPRNRILRPLPAALESIDPILEVHDKDAPGNTRNAVPVPLGQPLEETMNVMRKPDIDRSQALPTLDLVLGGQRAGKP